MNPLTTTEIREIESEREEYGHDARAMNKHSERTYQHAGRRFTLSQCVDAAPPSFELTYFPPIPEGCEATFARFVPIGGKDYWGGGLTWDEAEAKAKDAIIDLLAKTPDFKTHVPEPSFVAWEEAVDEILKAEFETSCLALNLSDLNVSFIRYYTNGLSPADAAAAAVEESK